MVSRSSALRVALLSLPLTFSASFAEAQTKPRTVTKPQPRPEARAMVQQLLREGRIMRPSEVRRGMRGIARSVFQGTQIVEFPIEVLGNLSRANSGGDIVLIKVLGGPVVERQTGIIAGMSGSPVYINGKMLGAIALGWGFPKEPIGGVTPITSMIETTLPDEVSTTGKPHTAKGKTSPIAEVLTPKAPLTVAGHSIARVVVSRDPRRLALSEGPHGATMTLRPCTTMLQLSGFSERSLPRLKKIFEPYGIDPVIVPSGGMMGLSGLQRMQTTQPPPSPGPLIGMPSGKKNVAPPPFVPGAAIGVQLVSGDMDQTAIGTVTFRWGNRVLAFGHPMFGQGAASLPMASAYVHEIFPAYDRSFKMGSPIQVLGSIQQDNAYAIGGTLGVKADTIPMVVSLRDQSRNIARTYKMQVMKDPVLTPQLIASVAGEALQSSLGLTSDKMVRIGLRMEMTNAPTIVRRNLIYSGDAIQQAALSDLGQTLSITQGNDFAKGNISRVNLDVQIESGHRVQLIKSITANRNLLKAGDAVQVKVVMEDAVNPNKTETRTFNFQVPTDATDGVMRIAAGAAGDYWPLQVRVGGAPPDPATLGELVSAWQKVGPQNELLVTASTQRLQLKVDRNTIENPAPAFTGLLAQSRSSSLGGFNDVEERRVVLTSMLGGAQTLAIPIQGVNHQKDAAPTPPPTTTADTPIPSTETTPDANAPKPAAQAPEDGEGNVAMPIRGTRLAVPANYVTRTPLDWDEGKPLFLAQINTLRAQAEEMQTTKRKKGGTAVISATPTAAPTALPAATATPTPSPLDATRVSRPAKSWVQSSAPDFLNGDFDRAIVTNTGEIRAAPATSQLVTSADPFAWSVAGDKDGNVYMGLGNTARVVKVTPNGTRTTLYENANEVGVTSLTCDDLGNVYAGVTPGGKVYRLGANGRKTLILNPSGASFAWALKFDAQGHLLIGTGGAQGRVYRLSNASVRGVPAAQVANEEQREAATPLLTVRSKQVHAIALRGDEMFLATGDEGVLYRVDAQNNVTALYEATTADGKTAPDAEILSVVAAPEGVYFGTSNSGTLYRYSPQNGVEALYPSPQKAIYALQRGTDGTLYMGTGDNGIVYRVTPGDDANSTRAARVLEPTQSQALSLNLAPTGDLLVGTGNNAAVYRLALDSRDSGTFTSGVFDAGNVVQWGAVRLVARGGAAVETRSGNTREPGATWSEFQPLQNEGGELRVTSPAARYLQYRVRVPAGSGGKNAPQLSRVEFVYRAKNTPPQVALASPKGGEYLDGQQKITWASKDDDSDPLRYKAYLSSDNGTTWVPLTLDDAAATTTNFDTTKQKDGTYLLKVEASDAARNPDDPRKDTAESQPFVIDNTPPTVDTASLKVTTSAEGTRVEFTVSDALSPIAGVGVKAGAATTATATTTPATPVVPATPTVPAPITPAAPTTSTAASTTAADEFTTAAPSDGIFDSRRERVTVLLSDTNVKNITIRVQDAAGNVTTVTLPVTR